MSGRAWAREGGPRGACLRTSSPDATRARRDVNCPLGSPPEVPVPAGGSRVAASPGVGGGRRQAPDPQPFPRRLFIERAATTRWRKVVALLRPVSPCNSKGGLGGPPGECWRWRLAPFGLRPRLPPTRTPRRPYASPPAPRLPRLASPAGVRSQGGGRAGGPGRAAGVGGRLAPGPSSRPGAAPHRRPARVSVEKWFCFFLLSTASETLLFMQKRRCQSRFRCRDLAPRRRLRQSPGVGVASVPEVPGGPGTPGRDPRRPSRAQSGPSSPPRSSPFPGGSLPSSPAGRIWSPRPRRRPRRPLSLRPAALPGSTASVRRSTGSSALACSRPCGSVGRSFAKWRRSVSTFGRAMNGSCRPSRDSRRRPRCVLLSSHGPGPPGRGRGAEVRRRRARSGQWTCAASEASTECQ